VGVFIQAAQEDRTLSQHDTVVVAVVAAAAFGDDSILGQYDYQVDLASLMLLAAGDVTDVAERLLRRWCWWDVLMLPLLLCFAFVVWFDGWEKSFSSGSKSGFPQMKNYLLSLLVAVVDGFRSLFWCDFILPSQ
jgi:hypothetical protein